MRRVLLVNDDQTGKWFIRGVAHVVHDFRPTDGIDEMVYHCDQPLGGPYNSFDVAARHLSNLVKHERFQERRQRLKRKARP